MDRPGKKRLIIAAAVLLWAVVTPFMWRDLRRRAPDQVRGPKWIWWVLSTNVSGSVAYWLCGRKEAH